MFQYLLFPEVLSLFATEDYNMMVHSNVNVKNFVSYLKFKVMTRVNFVSP